VFLFFARVPSAYKSVEPLGGHKPVKRIRGVPIEFQSFIWYDGSATVKAFLIAPSSSKIVSL
jgi:hypothetical protein